MDLKGLTKVSVRITDCVFFSLGQVKESLVVLIQHGLVRVVMPTAEELQRAHPRTFVYYEVKLRKGKERKELTRRYEGPPSIFYPLTTDPPKQKQIGGPGRGDAAAALPQVPLPGQGALRRRGPHARTHARTHATPIPKAIRSVHPLLI